MSKITIDMNSDLGEGFGAYQMGDDRAVLASVHQILSGVLGEPARASRDCRLRCYNVLNEDTEFFRPGPDMFPDAARRSTWNL